MSKYHVFVPFHLISLYKHAQLFSASSGKYFLVWEISDSFWKKASGTRSNLKYSHFLPYFHVHSLPSNRSQVISKWLIFTLNSVGILMYAINRDKVRHTQHICDIHTHIYVIYIHIQHITVLNVLETDINNGKFMILCTVYVSYFLCWEIFLKNIIESAFKWKKRSCMPDRNVFLKS